MPNNFGGDQYDPEYNPRARPRRRKVKREPRLRGCVYEDTRMGSRGVYVSVVIRGDHQLKPVPDHFHPVAQVWLNGWWYTVKFGHPIKMCRHCGLKFGWEFDPQNLPKTDNGRPAELKLCEEAQRG